MLSKQDVFCYIIIACGLYYISVQTAAEVTLDSSTDSDITLIESATKVRIEAGDRALNPGSYVGYLTVYDAATPDGLAWGSMVVRVVERPGDD